MITRCNCLNAPYHCLRASSHGLELSFETYLTRNDSNNQSREYGVKPAHTRNYYSKRNGRET